MRLKELLHVDVRRRFYVLGEQQVNRQRVDEIVVFKRVAVGELHLALVDVHLNHVALELDVLLTQHRAHATPYGARATIFGKLKRRVGAPVGVHLLFGLRLVLARRVLDGVLDGLLHVGHGHALTYPVVVHLLGMKAPHLEVVRIHKVIREAGAEERVEHVLKVGEWLALALVNAEQTVRCTLAWS